MLLCILVSSISKPEDDIIIGVSLSTALLFALGLFGSPDEVLDWPSDNNGYGVYAVLPLFEMVPSV